MRLTPSEYWALLPVDFWLMCEGYAERQEREFELIRDIVYGASRYNAANTAFSKDASKKISRQKFPWEKDRKPEFVDMNSVFKAFGALAERKN